MPKLKILFLDMAMSFARLPFSTDLIIKMLLQGNWSQAWSGYSKGKFYNIESHAKSIFQTPCKLQWRGSSAFACNHITHLKRTQT